MDQMTQFKDKGVRLNKNVTHSCLDETHSKHEVESKIIEKDTTCQLWTQKASCPQNNIGQVKLKGKIQSFY